MKSIHLQLSNLLLGMTAATLVACGPSTTRTNGDNPDDMNLTRNPGQAEVIDSINNPDIFEQSLERQFDKLPQSGEAKRIPWPGNYWPTYRDAINDRWDGPESDSPASKYAKAFSVDGLEDIISRAHGIDSLNYRKTCTNTSECDSRLGENCAIRTGKTEGRCIPTWFGLCHAWSPAAILELEPVREVTYNNVTFKVNDLKALLTLVYNRSRTRFLSGRCNASDSAGEVGFDNDGRPIASECRNTNPGTYHIILANYLGTKGLSLVEDVTFDAQVWNQPMRGFQVQENREVTAAEANELIGVGIIVGKSQEIETTVESGKFFNLEAMDVKPGNYVQVTMSSVSNSRSLDADLYVRFGAQATETEYDCRPYDMGNNEICTLAVPEGATKVYVSVKGGSSDPTPVKLVVTLDGTRSSTYEFNTDAAKLMYVRISASYIVESSASTDGNLRGQINNYTGNAVYEYILELDKDNLILGGEWIGRSKKSHPDFLWLPISNGPDSVSGVSYKNVKDLLNLSLAPLANQ